MKTMTVIFLGLLSGCTPLLWYKDGATQESFAQDRYACLQEAQQAYAMARAQGGSVIGPGYYNGSAGMAVNPMLFNACMQAHGYVLHE